MLTMAETKREHDRVFQMRVSDAFLASLDEWRRGQPDLPSRAEAVRRLVEFGTVKFSPGARLVGSHHREDPEKAN